MNLKETRAVNQCKFSVLTHNLRVLRSELDEQCNPEWEGNREVSNWSGHIYTFEVAQVVGRNLYVFVPLMVQVVVPESTSRSVSALFTVVVIWWCLYIWTKYKFAYYKLIIIVCKLGWFLPCSRSAAVLWWDGCAGCWTLWRLPADKVGFKCLNLFRWRTLLRTPHPVPSVHSSRSSSSDGGGTFGSLKSGKTGECINRPMIRSKLILAILNQ